MIELKLEKETVSILSVDTEYGPVRIAIPASMPKADLGFVLLPVAQVLILGDRANGSGNNGNGSNRIAGLVKPKAPKAQSPQGSNRRTKSDRRGLPRRKVVKRNRSGKREELECGHVIEPVPSNWKKHKSRACEACVEA